MQNSRKFKYTKASLEQTYDPEHDAYDPPPREGPYGVEWGSNDDDGRAHVISPAQIRVCCFGHLRFSKQRVIAVVPLILSLILFLAAIGIGYKYDRISDDAIPSPLMGMPYPPQNLHDLCSLSSLATEQGLEACKHACEPALCCTSPPSANCLEDYMTECLLYEPCSSLHMGALITSRTPVQVAPPHLAIICSRENVLSSEESRNACQEICLSAECCFEEDNNCLLTNFFECFGYRYCESLHGGDTYSFFEHVTAEVTKHTSPEKTPETDIQKVAEACSTKYMDEGLTLCQTLCSSRSCCFSDNKGSNCYVDNKVWCDEYSACNILKYNKTPPAVDHTQKNGIIPISDKSAHAITMNNVNTKCQLSNIKTDEQMQKCNDFCRGFACCYTAGLECSPDINCEDDLVCLDLILEEHKSGSDIISNSNTIAPPPPDIRDICSKDYLSTEAGKRNCTKVCSEGSCCVLSLENEGSCLKDNEKVCDAYYYHCKTIYRGGGASSPQDAAPLSTPGNAASTPSTPNKVTTPEDNVSTLSTPNTVTVPEDVASIPNTVAFPIAPSTLSEICDPASLSTDNGANACAQSCQPAQKCCVLKDKSSMENCDEEGCVPWYACVPLWYQRGYFEEEVKEMEEQESKSEMELKAGKAPAVTPAPVTTAPVTTAPVTTAPVTPLPTTLSTPPPSPQKSLSELCGIMNILTVQGADACSQQCQPALDCCTALDKQSNAECNTQFCDTYSPCEPLWYQLGYYEDENDENPPQEDNSNPATNNVQEMKEDALTDNELDMQALEQEQEELEQEEEELLLQEEELKEQQLELEAKQQQQMVELSNIEGKAEVEEYDEEFMKEEEAFEEQQYELEAQQKQQMEELEMNQDAEVDTGQQEMEQDETALEKAVLEDTAEIQAIEQLEDKEQSNQTAQAAEANAEIEKEEKEMEEELEKEEKDEEYAQMESEEMTLLDLCSPDSSPSQRHNCEKECNSAIRCFDSPSNCDKICEYYAPCQDIWTGLLPKVNSEEVKEVDKESPAYLCSQDSLSQEGLADCMDVCEDGICCIAQDGNYDCSSITERECDEYYSPCTAIWTEEDYHVDSVPEGSVVQTPNSSPDLSPFQTTDKDTVLPPDPEPVAQTTPKSSPIPSMEKDCTGPSLSTPTGRSACLSKCEPGLCCIGAHGDCAAAASDICPMFSICHRIWVIQGYFHKEIAQANTSTQNKEISTEDSSVIDIVCSEKNMSTVTGRSACEDACKEWDCCWDEGEGNCYLRNVGKCNAHLTCPNF